MPRPIPRMRKGKSNCGSFQKTLSIASIPSRKQYSRSARKPSGPELLVEKPDTDRYEIENPDLSFLRMLDGLDPVVFQFRHKQKRVEIDFPSQLVRRLFGRYRQLILFLFLNVNSSNLEPFRHL